VVALAVDLYNGTWEKQVIMEDLEAAVQATMVLDNLAVQAHQVKAIMAVQEPLSVAAVIKVVEVVVLERLAVVRVLVRLVTVE
jgi:hypothetical protein